VKEKLRSHLRSKEGFTLIELLIVIAIIAILVLIVVVAINPAERLREAADRRASSNVRSAGTLISTCVTRALSQTPPGTLDACDTQLEIEALGEGNVPAAVTINDDGATPAGNICSGQEGRAGTWWQYQHNTGEVDSAAAAALRACP
jgi:prepilin-type N-terminal cleavage/methylation domain-containing protein